MARHKFCEKRRIIMVEAIRHITSVYDSANQPDSSEVRRIGHDGEIRWISVRDLHVDPDYQRHSNPERASFIARTLDPEVLGILIGSEREDGSIWLLDGQHRRDGVDMRYGSHAQVLVYVMRGLTIQEEASIFWKSNKFRLHPTANDSFRARLLSGEESSVAIKRITEKHGINLCLTPTELGPKDVFAMATLERLYRNGTLDTVIYVIASAWPDENGAFKAKNMIGVDRFLTEWRYYFFKDLDEEAVDMRVQRLIKTMSDRTPRDYEQRAMFFRSTINSRPAVAYARAFHSYYNNKAPSRVALPQWGEFDSPYQSVLEVK